MPPRTRRLHVAMLNADTSVPNVYANLGTFGDILHRKLLAIANQTDKELNITHSVYNVVIGEYPQSLRGLDAVFITASAASSYDDEAWIHRLEDLVVMVYRKYPGIRLFGSCFGHHVICQALLKDHGVRVARRPGGWEIGVSKVEFTNDFREALAHVGYTAFEDDHMRLGLATRLPTPEDVGTDACGDDTKPSGCVPKTAYLQFVHADEVLLPPPDFSLPQPWVLLGSTEHCKVSGVYLPGRVLTLQGHFEFDMFASQETMRIFGADEGPREAADDSPDGGRASEQEYDDGEMVVDIVFRFLAGEWGAVTGMRSDEFPAHADLPTP